MGVGHCWMLVVYLISLGRLAEAIPYVLLCFVE